MDEYNGTDRRKTPSSIADLANEFRAFRIESRAFRLQAQKDIECLKTGFEQFAAKYEPHLQARITDEQRWKTIKADITASVIKSAVIAVVAGIGLILALGAKSWVAAWLASP